MSNTPYYVRIKSQTSVGIFGGGININKSNIRSTSVYIFSTNVVGAGQLLTYGTKDLAAAGNSVVGVFSGGNNSVNNKDTYSSITTLYKYSSNLTALGLNLSYESYNLSAAGNSISAIFSGGQTTVPLSNSSIYNISSNTLSIGANLSYLSSKLAAASNWKSAIFGGGSNNGLLSISSVYDFSNNTFISGSNLTLSVKDLAATGNYTLAIFGSGNTFLSSIGISNSSLYTYSTGIFTTSGNLTYSTYKNAAAGNNTAGVFGGGYYYDKIYSITSIYSYTNAAFTQLTSLSYSMSHMSAVSNSEPIETSTTSSTQTNGQAIFGGGGSSDSSLSVTSLYTYSSNATAAGQNLTYNSSGLAAAGNSTLGVFGGGGDVNGTTGVSITSLYTYSSNTTVSGTNLIYKKLSTAGTGNSVIGIFGGGFYGTSVYAPSNSDIYAYLASVTSIYIYSTNISTVGVNLTYSAGKLAAVGNSTLGVFGGGTTNVSASSTVIPLNTTSIYSYSINSTSDGQHLTYDGGSLAAAGNSTLGVFGGGSGPLSTTSLYTYSSNTTTSSTNLTYNAYAIAGASSSTLGVFGGAYIPSNSSLGVLGSGSSGGKTPSPTCIYKYASYSVSIGATLTYGDTYLAATSDTNDGIITGVLGSGSTVKLMTPAPIPDIAGFGIFGGGMNSVYVPSKYNYISSYLSSTIIYTYASNTTAAGTNLTYGAKNLAAVGSSVSGVFGSGSTSDGGLSTTSIYTYSSNTTYVGSELTFNFIGSSAAGNSTLGVFGGGYATIGLLSNSQSSTSIYTYSSNSTATGTDLAYIAYLSAAAGNSTLGIFGGGSSYDESTPKSLSTTSIYTYSSNAVVAGSNLLYNSSGLAAAGNSTLGVFSEGNHYPGGFGLPVTSLYTYASNTVVEGQDLTYMKEHASATGNSIFGVFGGGGTIDGYVSTTCIYVYSSKYVATLSHLTYSVYSLAATSSSNVGVI